MAEQGSAALRQTLFEITEGVYSEYTEAAQALGIPVDPPVHAQELCGELSLFAQIRIEGHGIPTQLRLFESFRDSHYFLHVPNGSEPDVVCLTWQQFLPVEKRTPELPRALIWPQATIVRRLGELGMPRHLWRVWTDTRAATNLWQRFDDPVLERILG